MDIQSLFAAQKYAALKPATAPNPMSAAATSFEQTLRASEDLANQAMTQDADPHALVHAMAQTELAVETAVAVRNKVVEAYNDILRMPI
jgi:flagellar hook-basal body complex protein FliE